jgi:hypothetical protein
MLMEVVVVAESCESWKRRNEGSRVNEQSMSKRVIKQVYCNEGEDDEAGTDKVKKRTRTEKKQKEG